MTAVIILSLSVIALIAFVFVPLPIEVKIKYVSSEKPEVKLFIFGIIPLKIQLDMNGSIQINPLKILIIDKIGVKITFNLLKSFSYIRYLAFIEAFMMGVLPIMGVKPAVGVAFTEKNEVEVYSEIKLRLKLNELIKELLWKKQVE